MSLDASLKSANALIRHRNVLTRDERLAVLKEQEKWKPGQSVYGLPKVGHRKAALAKTAKEEATDAAGAAPAAKGAAAAKGAPAGKGAAGAKGAAPAGKGAAAAKGASAAKGAAAPAAKGGAAGAKKK